MNECAYYAVMALIALVTVGLLGCGFLLYVLFQWVQETSGFAARQSSDLHAAEKSYKYNNPTTVIGFPERNGSVNRRGAQSRSKVRPEDVATSKSREYMDMRVCGARK
jgi:hypothetical protein